MFTITPKLMFQPSLVLFTDPTPTTPTPNDGNSGIKDVPVPGKRCPACFEKGETVWVIPGKCCPDCGTPVNRVRVEETRTSTFISTRIEESRPIWLTTTVLIGIIGIIVVGCINIIGNKDFYIFINDTVISKPGYIIGCISNVDNKDLYVLITDMIINKLGYAIGCINIDNTLNISGSIYHLYSIYDYTLDYFMNTFINDAPRAWGLYFQDSASPQMEAIVELHNNIMYFLAVILFGVGWILISVVKNFIKNKSPISNKYLNHGTLIELIWTITPALILILIAFPTFKLLFLIDDVTDPHISLGVESHQWYWSYQYADFTKNEDGSLIEFDYLASEPDLEKEALRLEVNNRLILPDILHTKFLIQPKDVTDSFEMPSLDLGLHIVLPHPGFMTDAYSVRLPVIALELRYAMLDIYFSELDAWINELDGMVCDSVDSIERNLRRLLRLAHNLNINALTDKIGWIHLSHHYALVAPDLYNLFDRDIGFRHLYEKCIQICEALHSFIPEDSGLYFRVSDIQANIDTEAKTLFANNCMQIGRVNRLTDSDLESKLEEIKNKYIQYPSTGLLFKSPSNVGNVGLGLSKTFSNGTVDPWYHVFFKYHGKSLYNTGHVGLGLAKHFSHGTVDPWHHIFFKNK